MTNEERNSVLEEAARHLELHPSRSSAQLRQMEFCASKVRELKWKQPTEMDKLKRDAYRVINETRPSKIADEIARLAKAKS